MKVCDNKTLTWPKVKQEVIACTNWLSEITSDDLLWAENWKNIVVLESLTETCSKGMFSELITDMKKQLIDNNLYDRRCKLVYIQIPKSFSLSVIEINNVKELIYSLYQNQGDIVLLWGISQRDNNISRMLCAVNDI